MKKNLKKDIALINKHSFPRYMEILQMPVKENRPGCTDYEVMIHNVDHIVTVHHQCNCFSSQTLDREGTIVDFACLLFGLNPEELCSNIVPYGIDRLMRTNHVTETARPGAVSLHH